MGEGWRIPTTNDQLEPTAFVIFDGVGDLTWRRISGFEALSVEEK
jgi:hypothetical protein